MTDSILQSRRECYVCRHKFGIKNDGQLDRHHVFGGSRRQISEQYGLTVYLCREHHTLQNGYSVHFDAELRHWLQARAQDALAQQVGEDQAIEILGKNYKE